MYDIHNIHDTGYRSFFPAILILPLLSLPIPSFNSLHFPSHPFIFNSLAFHIPFFPSLAFSSLSFIISSLPISSRRFPLPPPYILYSLHCHTYLHGCFHITVIFHVMSFHFSFVETRHVLCTDNTHIGLSDSGWDVCLVGTYKPKQDCLVYSFGYVITANWYFI